MMHQTPGTIKVPITRSSLSNIYSASLVSNGSNGSSGASKNLRSSASTHGKLVINGNFKKQLPSSNYIRNSPDIGPNRNQEKIKKGLSEKQNLQGLKKAYNEYDLLSFQDTEKVQKAKVSQGISSKKTSEPKVSLVDLRSLHLTDSIPDSVLTGSFKTHLDFGSDNMNSARSMKGSQGKRVAQGTRSVKKAF